MASLATRLSELITALGTDYKAIQTALGLKAPLASPALTGHPTGVTESAGDNSTRLATTAYVATAVAAPIQTVAFSIQGTLTATVYTFRWYPPRSVTISNVKISAGTAPTGSAVTVDVLKNGTSIFATTPANKPSIAATANVGTSGAPDTTALTATDYLTISVTAIGSTVAGANLVVEVNYS